MKEEDKITKTILQMPFEDIIIFAKYGYVCRQINKQKNNNNTISKGVGTQ